MKRLLINKTNEKAVRSFILGVSSTATISPAPCISAEQGYKMFLSEYEPTNLSNYDILVRDGFIVLSDLNSALGTVLHGQEKSGK